MQYIKTKDLIPGMVVSMHCIDETKGQIIMAGQQLTETLIEALKEHNVKGIYIEDIHPQQVCEKFWDKIRRCETKKEIDAFQKEAKKKVKAIVRENPQGLDKIREFDKSLYRHSISVAIYACEIGMALDYDDYLLRKLITAGLLHDVGKVFVSKAIWNKQGPLTDKERQEVLNHPVYGYYYLKRVHKNSIALAIYQHHENIDGSGYPNKDTGENIHPFAKILRVADVYDALVSKRSYKDKVSSYETHEYLDKNAGTLFDKTVVNALKQSIPLFPIGEKVLLSTKEIATVVKNNKEMQMYPTVQLGNGEIVDLSKTDITIRV